MTRFLTQFMLNANDEIAHTG